MSVPANRSEEGLLTLDTRLEIIYRKDGERFLISWDQRGEAPAIQRFDGQDWQPDNIGVRERFPVRIYSQKQLFELAQDPNALLGVIDDGEDVNGTEWERRIKESGDRYLSLTAAERAARTKAAELASRRAVLADVKRKLDLLQQSDNAELLAAYRLRVQQNHTWLSILADAESRIDAVARACDELVVADLDLGGSPEDDPDLDPVQRMHDRLRNVVSRMLAVLSPEVQRARQAFESLTSDEDADVRAWKTTVAASRTGSEKAAAQLAESGISSPDEYRSLVAQVSELERAIQRLEAEAGQAVKLGEGAAAALAEHRAHFDGRSKSRAGFAKSASSDRLRVEVKARANLAPEAIENALRERLGIERFDSDYRNLVSRLAPDPTEWSWERLDALVDDLRRVAAGSEGISQFRDQRFRTAIQKLTPERIDRLALYAPDDGVEVSFCDAPNGRMSPLSLGSPGQQTAALLAFVLGYGSEPILLDQPEDDLDNTLIYQVLVQRLRETKATRQVIVVTHNPNIVVHGDAELILSLDARNGQTRIACQGGLQEQAIRDEICRVMEGGWEAFEDRYRRMRPVGRTHG